jgi:hypothetical protein
MRVWITNEQWPASAQTVEDANTAGASMIWHGIPQSMQELVPADTVGPFDLTDPQQPAPLIDPLHQLAQAIVDAATLDDVKPTALAILGDGV